MRQLKITQSITTRDNSLNKYLKEVAQKQLINPDEEVELAERIKQGDKSALDKLVCANLRFVISAAKQYQNQGLTLPDLINEGNIGLIKAAWKFDETRGFKFISYAVWWIRQSILQALAEHSRSIRLPTNQIGIINKINKVLSKFEQKYERRPSTEELSKELSVPEDKISELLKASGKNISIDTPFSEDEDGSLLDVIPNVDSPLADSGTNKESVSIEINRALNTLHSRSKEILKMYYGIGCQEMTMEEIADKFGITRERVRQIKEESIKKLRKSSNFLKELL